MCGSLTTPIVYYYYFETVPIFIMNSKVFLDSKFKNINLAHHYLEGTLNALNWWLIVF